MTKLMQKSVTTVCRVRKPEKNRFLPGRMEETGKKVFLPQVPVSSRRNWKKLEEIHDSANKVLERSSQIL